MRRYSPVLFLLLAVVVLLGSRCSPTFPEPPVFSEPIKSTVIGSDDLPEVGYELYINKSQGYSIVRPANWYWRHYIAKDIVNIDSQVIDYFITDSAPLVGLDKNKLGLIVIEVSNKPINEYALAVADFAKTEVDIGGETANRYDGLVLSRVLAQPIVEYQFSHNNKTFRIFLNNSVDNVNNVKIFEKLVKSFKFD